MIRVFCTRSLPGALCKQAEARGVHIRSADFISIHHLHTDDTDAAIHMLPEQTGIPLVFTSKHAVPALPPGCQVYCLSGATAKAVAAFRGRSVIRGTADDAERLADLIIRDKSIGEVIFFCGNKRRNTLPEKLRAHHIRVREHIVYETLLTPQKIKEPYRGVIFFSPGAVESFFSVNKIAEDIPCFAIGNTTAGAVGQYSGNPVIVSPRPDAGIMIQTVLNYFKKPV